jgi:hypothetical protein
MERYRQARLTHPDKWSPPAKSRNFAMFIAAIVVVAALLVLAIVVFSHRVQFDRVNLPGWLTAIIRN